jgi:predicted nucleic acid-binding protein
VAPVLDANVVLRHLLDDHAEQSPRARTTLAALASGEQRAILPEPVIFEAVFTLERRQGRSRQLVRDQMRELIELPGMTVPNKRLLLDALDIHAQLSISLVDAYIAALALASDGQVISFDRDFDRIPGVTRVEP